ncbi:MAG: hypothetical protein NVV62_07885 [Terricaulis sp.]|nr:hypothetical protein [Terricaulis sp.]
MLAKSFTNLAPAALVLATLAGGWSAPAEASSFTVRVSGYVPTRCSGSLAVTGGSDLVKLGTITTNCNTAFSMTMHYPAELGPMQVAYDGRICTGQNGEVRLTDRSPPSIGAAPVRISAQNGALNGAPFYVVLAPQGL